MKQNGFSLVELSIVLVILGLLVGGILAGQSLIHASEVRAIGSEQQRYQTSVYAFRDKYFSLPGDMANATSVWGRDNANCPTHGGAAATPGTCNGNANGYIGPGASSSFEGARAWQQLSMAGLIEGNYTGLYDAGSKLTLGVNVPASKFPAGGWALLYRGTAANEAVWGISTNFLQFGGEGSGELWGYIINPIDTWNLDTKIDDGKPEYGKMIAGGGVCITPTAAYYNSLPANRAYDLTYTSGACHIMIRL